MRKFLYSVTLAILSIVSSQLRCEAQFPTFDYDNSSLMGTSQCDPVSCYEQLLPTTSGYSITNFYGTCHPANSADFPLTMRASASIGAKTACLAPYAASTQVYPSTTDYIEGPPPTTCNYEYYEVDYETAVAEVFSAAGTVVFHLSLTEGCDGSLSGPTQIGTLPC
jgi:hypothetical protein